MSMENFNPREVDEQKKESVLNKIYNTAKAVLVSKLLDNSKLDETLANNLYANRILEEERIAPNRFFSGITPALPEGTRIIDIHGAYFANIGDKMYYIRRYKGGFDLVDNTEDFVPREGFDRRENKRRSAFQKKYGLSTITEAIPRKEFYRYDETTDDLDNWIIHNDEGKINKNPNGKNITWWLKGEPYKAMEARSLINDKPGGRHLFAKQSALEDSIGGPLDQHRELTGEIITKGSVENGGITITPTSEADLPNIKGLQSLTYNPITKSMERGIFYDPNKPKDEKTDKEKIQELQSKIIDPSS